MDLHFIKRVSELFVLFCVFKISIILIKKGAIHVVLSVNGNLFFIVQNELHAKEALESGQKLSSPNGYYVLSMQPDGNLVLYKRSCYEGCWVAIWASQTTGKGSSPYKLKMQGSDNHLLIRDTEKTAIWATNVFIADHSPWKEGGFAVLQDDGNFVVYDGDKTPMWDTATVGGNNGIYGSGQKYQIPGILLFKQAYTMF